MSSEMAVREAEPSALPLVLAAKAPLLPSLRVRAQWASCATMTKSFLAKAFPSPQLQLWRLQSSSPTGVDDPTDASAVSEAVSEPEDEATDAARGEICELIVVAVQRVTGVNVSGNEDRSRPSSTRYSKSGSFWSSYKWSQLQSQQRVSCAVRSGSATKFSAQPESSQDGSTFVFDEKFVFERRENDAEYHQVTIDVSSVAPGSGEKRRLGQVAVNLNAEFSRPTGPLHKRSALTTSDGTQSDAEVHYVIHRLAVKNAAASAASRVLTRSLSSLNDADDMDAYGQIFPDLWYLC
ncbi:hypothetical protein BBJ28_00008694 [Nothophytophthora sp. Chile5]|nr:hypothetical protein BBJ28_00008694 [Nothophytophthora sp. Chile5]